MKEVQRLLNLALPEHQRRGLNRPGSRRHVCLYSVLERNSFIHRPGEFRVSEAVVEKVKVAETGIILKKGPLEVTHATKYIACLHKRISIVAKKGGCMKMKRMFPGAMILVLALILFIPAVVLGQNESKKAFSQEELEQMLAPIALYPDSLLTQVLMASTYPIEIVQADRFAKKNKDLKGQKLLEAAKNEDWDPTVKALLEFPEVLAMMSEKLDWTTKLGDAFLAQQKEVLDSVQRLRKKAEESGNLKTTKEQKVIVEKETIVIQPSNPEVIYVPSYNPTVVYGAWPYPAYPPYPYYPPGYGFAAATFGFMAGVAIGSSGCCWGSANWGHGEVDIDVNRENNFTKNNYNKERATQYQQKRGQQGGQQKWQHNPESRRGAAYRDNGTAQKFNRGSSSQAVQSRENFRGRAEQGRQDMSRGAGSQRSDAFSGVDRGSSARDFSNRGSSSRQSMSGGGGSRGGGGGSRGGGGGGRGGGRR
jgi:hypothetical protein